MSRQWDVDYLMDGWRCEIVERDDNALSVTVFGERGKSWRAVRDTIESAADLAWLIVVEQSTIAMIIDPGLDILDFEHRRLA